MEKTPGVPAQIVETPGKSDRDTEGAPTNRGKPFEVQGKPELRRQPSGQARSVCYYRRC